MEPLVTEAPEADDGPPPVPVGQRSPGPAARTPRPPAEPGTQPREPRAFVVDPTDPGAYAEIDHAVAEAEDGDRVVVRPGTYVVPVVVDRAIEIVGDGPRDDIILEPAGAEALSLCASGALVRKLTIRPAVAANDGTSWSAVWVRDVVGAIEDCDLSSHLGATVWAGGRSSRATIRRCRIHDSAQNGVAAWDEGTAFVEDSEISGNRWPGVMAQGRHAMASASGCRLVENLDLGAGAQDGATLVVERCLVARNAQGGIHLGRVSPFSRVEDNDIDENAEFGALVLGGIGGRIQRNRFRRNQNGIVADGGATPEVTDNEVTDSYGPSVLLTGERTDPTVIGNTIVSPRAPAIVVADGAAGRFERNRIVADRQPGAWIAEHGTAPTFIENTISGSSLIAIAVTGHAGGAYERNDLRGNKAGSWDLDDAGPVEIRDNLEDPRPPPDAPASTGYLN